MDETVACIAYPEPLHPGTLEAAAFSVNLIEEANTESKCSKLPEPPPHVGSTHSETINGVTFSVIQTDGAAMSQYGEGHVYRTFHDKKCYELDIRISSFSGQVTDPPTKEFDVTPVRESLAQVLKTFKFLK
jgi:hypothetical protein